MWTLLWIVLVSVQLCDSSEVPANVTRSPCTDQNHIFLAPGVLASGGTSRVCISRFHADGPARVQVTLVAEGQQLATASRELPPGDGGCIDISVPQKPNTKADLVVNVRYYESQCTWERRVSVRIGTGKVLVVHTERVRYRPGETVRVRILTLKPDLTPVHGQIDEVWIEGPRGAWEGTRAAGWTRVRTRLGIALIQHPLDELAPPGRWSVRAKLADGSQGAAAFWVGNYELPPFQLSVKHAPRVLRSSERLVWTVCVRYPWTEAVEGMLVIRIRGAGTGSDSSPGIRTAVRLRAPRACHRHAAAAKRIGLDGDNSPDVVVADFSFQEEGTRIWQNTTVVSQVVDKAVSLEFLTKHRAVISPGLPYKLKVKATRWDDKPAPNVKVHVCRLTAQGSGPDSECKDALTDDSGIAKFMFTADGGDTAVYKFEATLYNDTTISASPLFLPVQRTGSVHAALGPIKADPYAARTFVPLYLNMKNVNQAITAHFVVITRGGIIYRWGATTQCPTTNPTDEIQIAARDSPCPNINYPRVDQSPPRLEVNVSDALLDRHLLRVMLPIKVTHQMCPDSHLVAYFYLNGELISASKHFEMEECFANKVEATWASRQTPPGSTISLEVSTTGPALCALTALDTAAKWIQPGESVKDVVIAALRRLIEGHRNLTEYDAAGECFLTTDNPDLPTTSAELTAAWLSAAGVRVVGGDIPRSRTCPASSAMPLTADDLMVPRSDFSEAWLWRLVAVGSNGTATTTARAPDSITRYEASAVCVARNGLAVSAPATLQVFREFFIHADSPRRLRRGDSTFILYRIFNYLYEPLSVQIQILTDPHLEASDYTETACISARSSIARRVEVRARIAGSARVSVRAKSFDGGCPNVTRSRSGVSDEVIIQVTVDPEGVPVQEHKSILLCGRDSPESSTSRVMWNWPSAQAVPGTEALTVWASGDITGPLLADADDLVLLPRGCGEQNMARMATNLLALKQLDPESVAAASARDHVARGFTRQLQYIHPSGGFSAFGSSDATPSTWLTAFAVRYLRKAHQALTPDLPAPPALERAEQWLLSQQMENGCFRNEGQVFHRELRGGLNEEGEIASVALTAYVITSLAESAILSTRVLHNALSCLRALPPLKTKSPNRVYAHSLLAYAFMRLRRYEDEVRGSNEAIQWKKRDGFEGLERDEEMRELVELLKLARRSGDFVWWETGNLATSIEATGYALLALSRCPGSLLGSSCAHDARAALRWLSTHRSASGGFVSTQDTLVALEALTAWTAVDPQTPTNLTVTVRSSSSSQTVSVESGMKVPEVLKMGVGDQINVHVDGTGCALIQATRSYNSYAPDTNQNKLLTVEVAVHTDGPFNCGVNQTNCYCAAVVETCVIWSGVFPEMALLEVSLPGGFGADAAKLYSQLHQNSTLLRRIELTPSSSRATLYLGSRDGSATLGRGGHQCFELHAVGPQTRTKPGCARLLDYYSPVVNDTQMFTIPEECPPRIMHESNQYLASDNLFNKAKSLSDEIIITNEFSFEDIPEGIPLEDPLYDNNLALQQAIEMVTNKAEIGKNCKSDNVVEATTIAKPGSIDETNVDNAVTGEIVTEAKDAREAKAHKISDKLEEAHRITGKLASFDDERETEEPMLDSENVEHPQIDIRTQDAENVQTDISQTKADIKQDMTVQDPGVQNPNLADFHVIDSEKDLEVPAGIEGPIPAMVLPPPSYKPRTYVTTGYPYYRIPYRRPELPIPRTYEIYHPAFYHQTYFYQPTMEDAYRNKFRYGRGAG
ncbi:a-macroglobulin complement component domain-containing protein [Phthorimaea operculella]|nr:a-macroglobulin complement component domain-containing protein [Phthorimaea operculella]